jgi:hypothetical protein
MVLSEVVMRWRYLLENCDGRDVHSTEGVMTATMVVAVPVMRETAMMAVIITTEVAVM